MRTMILISILFIMSCQKDVEKVVLKETPGPENVVVFDTDEAPVLPRTGEYYPLFYKQSLTTDNYLLYPTPRIQNAFVKSKIDSVFMNKKGSGNVNIDGVPHTAYEVTIDYKDGSDESFLVTSVSGAQSYGYVPFGDKVVNDNIPGKKVTLERTTQKVLYVEWRTCALKNKYKYKIYRDTTLVGEEYIPGTSITGTAFIMPHK